MKEVDKYVAASRFNEPVCLSARTAIQRAVVARYHQQEEHTGRIPGYLGSPGR